MKKFFSKLVIVAMSVSMLPTVASAFRRQGDGSCVLLFLSLKLKNDYTFSQNYTD